MTQKENEALDSILDSMTDDEEVEKKIDEFARNKNRTARVQRARQAAAEFTKAYSSSKDASGSASLSAGSVSAGDQRQGEGSETVQPAGPSEEDAHTENTAGESGFSPAEESGEDLSIPEFVQNRSLSAEPVIISTPGAVNTEAWQDEQPDPVPSAENPEGGQTKVFGTAPVQETNTVSVSSDEIQHLLDKDKTAHEEPLLRREYYEEEPQEEYERAGDDYYEEPRAPKSSSFNWKIAGIVGGTLLAAALLFGGYTLVRSWMNSTPAQSTDTTEDYNLLSQWIDQYESYDEDQKKEIKDYRTVYSKLNAEQKKEINERLEALTGKNFNELLAAANTKDKPDSKNDNTANAEKKARLQGQISQLRDEVSRLEASLRDTQNTISDRQNTYNQKVGIQDARKADYDKAQNDLNTLTEEKRNLQADQSSYDIQIRQIDDKISRLPGDGDDSADDQKKALEDQRQQLSDKLDQIIARLNSIDGDISNAQNAVNSAKEAYDRATDDADAAKAEYDAVAGSDAQYQTQINDKNAQIASLQSEYDSIQ